MCCCEEGWHACVVAGTSGSETGGQPVHGMLSVHLGCDCSSGLHDLDSAVEFLCVKPEQRAASYERWCIAYRQSAVAYRASVI